MEDTMQHKLGIAMLVGGLLIGATGAIAQNIATAVPAPKGDFVVFTDKAHALSQTARETVRTIADEAGSARHVTLIGRAENVASVKNELMRNGVPAQSIVVKQDRTPIAKADGIDPVERRVEIKF